MEDVGGQANTIMSMGDLERGLGQPEQARSHYQTALPL